MESGAIFGQLIWSVKGQDPGRSAELGEDRAGSDPPANMAGLEEPDASPERLATRCQSGSLEAFELLVELYETRIFQYLWHLTGNRHDAEDLTQETFLKAYQAIQRYDSQRSFSTWIYTIAKRSAYNHFRSARRVEKNPEPATDVDPNDPAQALEQKDGAQSLWRLARRLKPKQFEALWLRYGEGFSMVDTARVMGTNQIYVKVLLHRARQEMGRLLRNTKVDF